MTLRPILALAALALAGCAEAGPSLRPRSVLRDTQTVHNAEATRIWIIQDPGDSQRVVMCDVDLLKSGQPLCRQWPEALPAQPMAPMTPAP